MEQRIQQAVDLFEEGYSCSQAILAAYAGTFNLDRNTALRIASGLGGGVGRNGDMCGAVTGAVLVLGLQFGTTDPKDKTAKFETYKKVRMFTEEFKHRAGSVVCRELLGFDFNTPEGLIRVNQPGAFEHCPEFVRIAAEILESMLDK
ncbi:MAG: C_GCAxxG_C_C family protein [Sedimentisphaerales bacterium]|nr:C_GCAxxG_C_C family protein [Sedimentisphaerales bacterium]